MGKKAIPFEEFIGAVEAQYQAFIESLHEYLLANGCSASIELKKTGYFVSYVFTKTKKSIINFVFRKKGLIVRIYGGNAHKYPDLLQSLPDDMVKSIEKAPACKRLLNPDDCSPKCSMGYDFIITDKRFQKCRYSCFMFTVNHENNGYIQSFIENEIRERSAA